MTFSTQSITDLFTLNPLLQSFLNGLIFTVSTAFQSEFMVGVASLLPAISLFLLLSGSIIGIALLLHKLAITYLQLKQSYGFLEVKPPKETLLSSYTTQQLFTLIHGLANQRSFFERIIGYHKCYAFEIVSTKNDGIRYLLRVNHDDLDLIKKSLISYLPGISVTKAKDYLSDVPQAQIAEFKLARHFAFPLKKQDDLKEHDPIAYITGSMTKLAPNETVVFQLVSSPVNKNNFPAIKRISRLIYTNKDLVSSLKGSTVLDQSLLIVKLFFWGIFYIFSLPLGIFIFLVTNGKDGPFLGLPVYGERDKTANPYQQELETMVKGKLDQPLFATTIRLSVIGNKPDASKRIRGFISSLSSFSSTYQSIRRVRQLKLKHLEKLQYFAFSNRILNPLATSILSVSEVADLYHFPFSSTTRTEDIQKIHSKKLPAPVSLKKADNLDLVFAKNDYGGGSTKIGLTQDERRRHMYIIGATGTGKSTMLLSMIKQDIDNGKGICVIDPHGDLIEKILPQIPDDRIKDVVYFNPDDISYPMGINLLERTPGLNPEDDLKEKEFITESIISLFHKIYSDKYSGPRMEYILRNTIHTAFTLENPTLFTIYKLLINPKFRKSATKNLTDEHLNDFWKYEFTQAGNYQKVKMISPITNKIGRFLFSPSAKRILEQEKSTINFDEIMDGGKILLCNVSKGRIGEDNSEMFGVVVMAKIQLAALKRARRREQDRKDFYLYVDEFQNFATEAFGQILSEARKYKLNAILAHQTTSQLEDKSLVNITLANTGTVICFRTANPEDEKLILPQFAPYIERGEIASLPSYHFYMRLGALNPEEPFSGTTIPIKASGSEVQAEKVIESSRRLYAMRFDGSYNQKVSYSVNESKLKKKTADSILP